MKDKFSISGGYMCDLSYITVGDTLPAFLHLTNGKWWFDIKLFWEWYQPLANAGMSMHRISIYCVGGKMPTGGRGVLFMPWKFIPEKDAWNLSIFNEDYFTILRQMCIQLNKMNVQVMFDLADECQAHGKERQDQSPYFHNVNGVGEVYDEKALPFLKAFAKKAISVTQDLKLKSGERGVIYEIGNELNAKGGVEVGEVIVDELFAAGIEPYNISLGAYMIPCKFMGKNLPWAEQYQCASTFTNQEYIDKHLGEHYEKQYPAARNMAFRPIHGIGEEQILPDRPYGERFHQAMDWWVSHIASSVRMFLSTDGTDGSDGHGGRPSAKRIKAMILYALDLCPKNVNYMVAGHYKFAFDYLPGGEKTSEVVKVIDAMAEAHNERFGVWPDNRGKIPPYEEPYECKVGEVKKETCWDGSTVTTHICENGKWKMTGNVCPIKPPDQCKVGDVQKVKCYDGSEIISYTCENGKWKPTGNVCPVKECEIGQTKTEICSDGSTITTHICENGKWKPTGNICPIVSTPSHTPWSHIFKWPPNFKAFFKHIFGIKH